MNSRQDTPGDGGAPERASGTGVRPVRWDQVGFDDAVFAPMIRTVRAKTLPFQYAQLVETGRLEALRLRWKPGDEPVPHIFWDSDVAKWIEAASYSLATDPDPELERRVDEAIDLLAGAQQPDGYLNTYFTVVQPGKRFTDLRDAHELYCAGHLIEAGVAHFEATGKRSLLDVVTRYADYIDSVFGREPGQIRGYDGHEEIELALVKLHRVTGELRYLRLASYFVDERGRQPFFFDEEAARRATAGYFGDYFPDRETRPRRSREYHQAHLPVREQTEAVGHAVRAMYLYSAMADLAGETEDPSLLAACRTLWTHLTTRRMYVTGGIGSTAEIEGFTDDFDLPNETAYAETCAAIGLVLWAHRMAHVDRDSRYVDVLELALYNGVLAGLSLDGTRFFYDNPLASAGGVHRQEWFSVACCPPNIARLLTSLGQYVYSCGPEEVVVHLYVAGRARLAVAGRSVVVEQSGDYPFDGDVRLRVRTETPAEFTVSLRVPGWCREVVVRVNGEPVAAEPVQGYLPVRRTWADGDEIALELDLSPRRIRAHPAVVADAGCVALARGPLIYCVEEADNGPALHSLVVPLDAPIEPGTAPGLPGVPCLTVAGRREVAEAWGGVLYRAEAPPVADQAVVAVPYYAWANRGHGEMRVWVREGGAAS